MDIRLFLICFLFLPSILFSQERNLDFIDNDTQRIMQSLDSLELAYKLQPKVNYEIGTSVFTNFDGMYGFNTYVAPSMVFQPSEKWIVDGGLILGRTQMFNMPFANINGTTYNMDQTVLTMGAYARGTYLVNDKLYMGGTGYVSYNNIESSLPNDRRNAYNNISGETFVGYKFSDSFSVEAGFRVGNATPRNSYDLYRR